MIDFSQQIANFTNYGTYNYKFDVVGNEILNPASPIFQQVYFVLPLGNYVYNNFKILSFYDPNFTEFIPQQSTSSVTSSIFSQDAIDKINTITYQNIQLQNQLETLISSSQLNSGPTDEQSIKNTIIGLRILLGEGSSEKDFQSVYPYLPLGLESN